MFIVPIIAALAISTIPTAQPIPAHRSIKVVNSGSAASATTCAKVWKTYPYGVGVSGAKDKVKTGFSPVNNFKKVSKTKFKSFAKLDADKDKVACELPKYKNCTKLNSIYPHGLGLKGARDKVAGSSQPVTGFSITSTAIYNTNKANLDRDNDKILCEKR